MKSSSSKMNGYLFLIASIGFIAAAYIGGEQIFYVLGVVFAGIGAISLNQASKKKESE